jgi:predicted transcriptional regulator
MKLSEIAQALDATILSGENKLDMDITRCGASDLMSDILAGAADGSLLITGLATVQAIRTASIAGIGAVVFVRGKMPSQEVISTAAGQGMPILSSPHSMFNTCGRLHALKLTGLKGNR